MQHHTQTTTKIVSQSGYVIPSVPVPPPLVPMKYSPLLNSQGSVKHPVPAPLAPVLEPLPDIQRLQDKNQKNQELKAKEEAVAAKPRDGGWLDSIAGALESSAVMIEKGFHYVADEIDSGIRASNYTDAQKKWRECFRLDPNNERLWREYTCRCVSVPTWFNGALYISDHYVGFISDKWIKNPIQGATPHGHNYRLIFLIPLGNIQSIQLGESKSNSGDAPPTITMSHSIMNRLPNPDSLMIFTKDSAIHNFYGFYNFDSAYNVLDHAWRASFMHDVTVPLPLPIPLEQNLPNPPLLPNPPTASMAGSVPPIPIQQPNYEFQQVTLPPTPAPQYPPVATQYPAPSSTQYQPVTYPAGYPPGYHS